MITQEELDKRYKKARKNEDYIQRNLNNDFADVAQNLVSKGIKRGSCRWIYYNTIGSLEVLRKRELNLKFSFQPHEGLKTKIIYLIAKINFYLFY